MAEDSKRDGRSSPDERYREFEKDNAAWDRRVKNTLDELDKVAQKAKRVARGRRTSA
jgi:hypothetical protein